MVARLIVSMPMAEDGCGLQPYVESFVPPGWRVSAGTLAALTARGFAVCADEAGVHLLTGPAPTLVRARLFGFRRLPPRDAWRARTLATEASRAARQDGLVRIAVRGDDLRRAGRLHALLAAVDLVLGHGATAATYPSVAAVQPAA